MAFDIKSLLSGGIDKVIDSVGTLLDNLVTSDEERELIKAELEKVKYNTKLETENQYLKHEEEITKRWVSDNEHTTTRLVRPAMVIWSFVLFTVVMLSDGNISGFIIKDAYIPMLETIVVTVTIAYFGSRGIEKTVKTLKRNDDYVSTF